MSSERDQLYQAVSRRLAASNPAAAWENLIAAGVVGFRVAEEHGGLGMSPSEAEPIMAAVGETGRSSPFLESSIVAAGLLGRWPKAAAGILGKVAKEGAVCAVAGLDPRLRVNLSATEKNGEWILSGSARLVLHADIAAAALAIVPIGMRTGLFLLDGVPETAIAYPTIDGRTAADVTLDGVIATLLSPDAGDAVDAALDEARACIAVEAAAIMRRLVRDTVEYMRQRRQFGQPLASFQVIQHRLVDMHIQTRRASAIAGRAMAAIDKPAERRSSLVSAAKVTAALAGRYVGQQAVQLHGAVGMTEELPLAGFFKRLTVIADELGSADEHAARHSALRDAVDRLEA